LPADQAQLQLNAFIEITQDYEGYLRRIPRADSLSSFER
jgi:hypothetical protein